MSASGHRGTQPRLQGFREGFKEEVMSKQRPVEESEARPHGEAAGQGVGAGGRCCMCKGPECREKEAQPDHEGLCSSGCRVGPTPGMAGSLQVVSRGVVP